MPGLYSSYTGSCDFLELIEWLGCCFGVESKLDLDEYEGS